MELKDQLKKLIELQNWSAVRTWFTYWDTPEEQAQKILLWGRMIFQDYFRDPSPAFHLDLIQRNFSNKNEFTAAPRGFSKTTINQLCIMYEVVYKLQPFIVVVEKTFNEAAEVLEAIRHEFKENTYLNKLYGNILIKHEKDKDAYGDLVINGIRLRAKGFDAPIRGMKHKAWRPTKIYVDDVEKDEHINSIDQREKYKDRFISGILPSVDTKGTVKMVGTILHMDSLLKNMIDNHGGKIYRAYDIKDPANTLLWPQRWPLEALDKKKKEMTDDGFGSSKFTQEYLNEPVDDEFRPFKWEWLQKEYTTLPEILAIYATIDVAESVKDKSDYTGVTVVGIDEHHNWYVLHAQRYKVTITGLVDLVFDIWKKYKPIQIGIEKKSLEYQVTPLLEVKADETGTYPAIVELQHGGRSKEDRIRGALQGRFENGKVWFKANPNDDTKILRGELYDFPAAKNDDLSDALAYIDQFANKAYIETKNEMPKPSVYNDDYYFKMATEGMPSAEGEAVFQDYNDL